MCCRPGICGLPKTIGKSRRSLSRGCAPRQQYRCGVADIQGPFRTISGNSSLIPPGHPISRGAGDRPTTADSSQSGGPRGPLGIRGDPGLATFLGPEEVRGGQTVHKKGRFPSRRGEVLSRLHPGCGPHGVFPLRVAPLTPEDRAYYLEINARLGGTTDKVTRLGFDEPGLLLAAFGLLPMQTGTSFAALSGRTAVNKLKVLQHLEWALRGKLAN